MTEPEVNQTHETPHVPIWERDFSDLKRPKAHEPLLTTLEGLTGKIVIMGGSFDPLHNAHLEMAKQVRDFTEAVALILIPTAQNPLKAHQTVASGEDRVQMIRETLVHEPNLYVSPIEIDREGKAPSYTADTMREIRSSIAEDAELFLLLGIDNVLGFKNWRGIDQIFSLVDGVMTVPRGERGLDLITEENTELPRDYVESLKENFLPLSIPELSSTEIRESYKEGDDPSELLPPEISRYIEEKALKYS